LKPDASPPAPWWRLVALLTALNALNFLDRQLVAALAPLLMEDLRLTRTDLGLLLGFGFVALFSLVGLALGFAADSVSRTRLIAMGLALWSVMTAASGAAQGFGHLAAARVLVGVGEATLVPASLSLLADVVPAGRLGLATAIFTSATPVGQALSYVAAGLLAPHLGWRGCFMLLGGAGLLLIGPLLATAEPPRARGQSGGGRASPRALASAVAQTFLSIPSAGLIVLGAVAFAFATGAALHVITWLVQERGFTPAHAAARAGLITAGTGLVGNVLLGDLADRLERRVPGGRAWTLAALAPLLALASFVFYSAPPSSPVFHAAWTLSTAALLGWMSVVFAAFQLLIPPRIRATVIAFAILCANLAGLGPGALVTGWLGDAASLGYGLRLSAAVALLAGVPFAAVALRYGRDRERARALADAPFSARSRTR
jgi:MFS family permease